jgi:hypothetical protein
MKAGETAAFDSKKELNVTIATETAYGFALTSDVAENLCQFAPSPYASHRRQVGDANHADATSFPDPVASRVQGFEACGSHV